MIEIPVRQIEVTSSNKSARVGSIGYTTIMFFTHGQNTNLLSTYSIFTRFGKAGVDRIDMVRSISEYVSLLDYCPDDHHIDEFRDFITSHYDILPRKYTTNISFKFTDMTKNVCSLATWEFIGYLTALSLFLSRYEGGRRFGDRGTLLYFSNNELSELKINNTPPSRICDFIASAYLIGTEEKNHSHMDYLIDHFTTLENREMVLRRIHKSMSKHHRPINAYINQLNETKELITELLEEAEKRFFGG